MKKKALNNKLKLQKENIVNLNQLNLIKGGLKGPTKYYTENCGVRDTLTVKTITCCDF
ncbi:MAG: hypothetical protein GQ564_18635 [Bacteroidales bacterium]|nr:hypothetical protein [Bacteroidales bacterium]